MALPLNILVSILLFSLFFFAFFSSKSNTGAGIVLLSFFAFLSPKKPRPCVEHGSQRAAAHRHEAAQRLRGGRSVVVALARAPLHAARLTSRSLGRCDRGSHHGGGGAAVELVGPAMIVLDEFQAPFPPAMAYGCS